MPRGFSSVSHDDSTLIATSCVLSPDQLNRIRAYAAANQTSQSDVVRTAIDRLTREVVREAFGDRQDGCLTKHRLIFEAE